MASVDSRARVALTRLTVGGVGCLVLRRAYQLLLKNLTKRSDHIKETDERKDYVASTASLIATSRALVSEIDPEFMHDPYAALFAAPADLAARREKLAEGGVRFLDRIAIRTKFFDAFLLARARAGAQQIVLLGAGMDMRAFREDMEWPGGVRVFLLDMPRTFEERRRGLAALKAPPPPRVAQVDLVEADLLEDDWGAALTARGFDRSQPATWLLEGLVYYFHEPQVRALMQAVTRLSAAGSTMGLSSVSGPLNSKASIGNKMGFRWAHPYPEVFLKEFGWIADTVHTLGDPAISDEWYTRHPPRPPPPPPRSESVTGRTYYFTARLASQ